MNTTTTTIAWNGPTCGTCGVRWLGSHTCSNEDLLRRIDELKALLRWDVPGCPCRPENGGMGVCGCILGGPQVTC